MSNCLARRDRLLVRWARQMSPEVDLLAVERLARCLFCEHSGANAS
jgi:hypothetical protein